MNRMVRFVGMFAMRTVFFSQLVEINFKVAQEHFHINREAFYGFLFLSELSCKFLALNLD